MALRHIPGDRQAEPRTAFVPAPGVVQADEPLEDPLPLVLGHTRPVVTDGEHDPAALTPYGSGARAGRVTPGVVEQIAQHPAQLAA